ncbi:acyl-CoA dehydrogenase family protein [Cupriavidus basilensis]|uniref:acyl-CoA dehydrogenase family protein n=1 Tax=Cupriavidus basilensis TaxID=68895 RepID=UPI00157BAC41|nr:acyl-CoA dehydrogenase family protein [Cupriavidus basilensis]NUA31991.1 hypothetical protein [Cupriavidus basilensis]
MDLTQEFDQLLDTKARQLITAAREFAVETVLPASRLAAGAHEWASATIRAACGIGLAGMEIPVALGGHGMRYLVRARVAEELARVDFPFAFALINHHNAAARIAAHGTAVAKDRFLPPMLAGDSVGCTAMSEPEAGSDFAAITTTARRVTDGWRLDGAKRWIANAAGADVLLTFAQTNLAKGAAGIACFIADGRNPGFTRGPLDPFAAMGAAGIGGFTLSAYHVPDDHVLYPPGEGFAQAMAGVNKARTHIAAMACGMVAASLDIALAYARKRKTFGKSLLEHQGLRWSLADVATTLEAMRMFTYRAATLIDQERKEAILAAAMAKKFAGEQCLPAIARCMQAMGAVGMGDDNVPAKHLLAAKAIGFADGTTEMMNERIGAILA